MKPIPSAKPKDDGLKILHHIALRAWITEDDHQLVKVEANLVEPLSFGLGLLAKFQPGSQLRFERRRVGDNFWTLSKIEVEMTGRLLLMKSMRERRITEYSDFKKYTVETVVKPVLASDP